MSDAHVHNWSGFWPVVRIGDTALFPTYFLITSLSFCICILWLVRRAERRDFPRNTLLDLSIVVMAAGFLGAFLEPGTSRAARRRLSKTRWWARSASRLKRKGLTRDLYTGSGAKFAVKVGE